MNADRRAYIIAARRCALGRPGGLHGHRRIEQLAVPVLHATLADAGLDPSDIDEMILGNTTAGGNPARLIGLAAGCRDTLNATTIDRSCASSLAAVWSAMQTVREGTASVVVTGGAEAISTAPWRVKKPRALHHTPRFVDPVGRALTGGSQGNGRWVDDAELARSLQISRAAQDARAFAGHVAALEARQAVEWAREIVAVSRDPATSRDESIGHYHDEDDLAAEEPFEDGGTSTPGNTAVPHDGAAFVIVVSDAVHARLGRPPALGVVGHAALGTGPAEAAHAPMLAARRLIESCGAVDTGASDELAQSIVWELEESSAAQHLAFARLMRIEPERISSGGGAVARGHPLGASGAVLTTRLFSQLIGRTNGVGHLPAGRDAAEAPAPDKPARGVAVQGSLDGHGMALLLERIA